MSDQTPDLWWSSTIGLIQKKGSGWGLYDVRASCDMKWLPADAVKLGAVSNESVGDMMTRIAELRTELDGLKREILAALDEEKSLPTWARDADLAFALLDRIRFIVEVETR